ncbi:MAG: GntR family transcriptional regulator [Sphaerochaetaceae bacterium]|jgi:DNA-binding GntR family transcriptional regulator|nr:GntR family transcriptional regulator [Sphaerochaetaceae bacterium]MDX9939136.1 GntR family transcriptional regulator [Sphaerochaetaceae bacterium]
MSKPSLRYQQVKEHIKQEISSLQVGDNMLPSEPTLTRALGMSRETVRKAIAELSREGLVSTWHGKGNFGHPSVLNLPMRYDLNSNFRLLLEQAGFDVLAQRGAHEITDLPERLRRRFPTPDAPFIRFTQELTAHGELAIISDVYIKRDHLKVLPEAGPYTDNIDSFFSTHCTAPIEYVIAWPKADNHAINAVRFGLDPACPLLGWEEAYYNIHDVCMGIIEVHFNPKVMDLSMLLHFS